MVKGTTRRVIVIKSPDPNIFDEAIFIVREDASVRGVTGAQILEEAQSAARKYIEERKTPRFAALAKLPPHLYALLGAGATAIVWAVSAIFLR